MSALATPKTYRRSPFAARPRLLGAVRPRVCCQLRGEFDPPLLPAIAVNTQRESGPLRFPNAKLIVVLREPGRSAPSLRTGRTCVRQAPGACRRRPSRPLRWEEDRPGLPQPGPVVLALNTALVPPTPPPRYGGATGGLVGLFSRRASQVPWFPAYGPCLESTTRPWRLGSGSARRFLARAPGMLTEPNRRRERDRAPGPPTLAAHRAPSVHYACGRPAL